MSNRRRVCRCGVRHDRPRNVKEIIRGTMPANARYNSIKNKSDEEKEIMYRQVTINARDRNVLRRVKSELYTIETCQESTWISWGSLGKLNLESRDDRRHLTTANDPFLASVRNVDINCSSPLPIVILCISN